MDSSTQETIHSDPKWFFKHRKEEIVRTINWTVRDMMLQNKDFFNQVEMDDDLLKQFLVANKDVMQTVETPRILKPKTISQPIQHQSDSMNLDDSEGDTNVKVPSTPHHPNPITPPATPLSRTQKKSAKKKLKKLQKQQQQQEENPFISPSRPSPEQTPSGSKVVTFNIVPLQQATSSKSSDNIKPSEQSTITSEKKRKQEHLADNFNNSNLILTGYCPQQEEQAKLLDLIVYDIPAKWDSYTLLGNLSFWGKIVSISTRCHKKYLSARVRLIPNHECLKAYNRGEWTVGLDMTESILFPNCTFSKFLAESGIKSFKVIKESSGQSKLIGYFATWDQASKCISTPQLWNDVSLPWCRYFSPKLDFKKHLPAQFGNAGNNNTRQLKPTRPLYTNLDNPRFLDVYNNLYSSSKPQSSNPDDHKNSLSQRLFKRQHVNNEIDEFQLYNLLPVSPPDTDPLEFWKINESQYPRLANMARDYLAIPSTSVPSEQCFSAVLSLQNNYDDLTVDKVNNKHITDEVDPNTIIGLFMGIDGDYISNIDKIGDDLIYSDAKDFQFKISYQKALSSLFICDIDKNHYHWRNWQISNYYLFELLKEQSEFPPQISISVNKTYENNKTLVKHCYCKGCNKSNQTIFKIVIGKIDIIQSKEFVKINVVYYLPNKRKCKHLYRKMFGQCYGYARQVLVKSKDFGLPHDMRKKILLNIKNEVHYTGNWQDYTRQLIKPVSYYLTPVNNSNNKRILNALFTMLLSNNSSDAPLVDVFELVMNNLSSKNLQNYFHVFRQKGLQLFGSNSVPFLINIDCA
ncbi:hypothetical protein RclHR1_03880002 [Rhizophagus clarus]|uniref:HAT C-terminal dimerisation domain-containing protein n=1 Tax=Rhizophagus clarus TaxID=94130 RepID=A0A2Z6RVF4_9GLOM|nr:hypothetical protein RclHR1_03880002 [Rhizophagus clarus]